MKVDIRELCDIPGQNYTPLCDGAGVCSARTLHFCIPDWYQ